MKVQTKSLVVLILVLALILVNDGFDELRLGTVLSPSLGPRISADRYLDTPGSWKRAARKKRDARNRLAR